MKEKIKKYRFMIPSLLFMIIMSILPLLFGLIYMDKVKNIIFEYFTLLLLIIEMILLIIVVVQIIFSILDVYKKVEFSHNDKLKWYLLLFFLNIFVLPYYELEYKRKDNESRKKTLLYLVIILVLSVTSIFTSIYSTILFNEHVNKQKAIEKQKSEVRNIIVSNDNKFEMTFKLGFKKENVSEYDLYVKDNKRQLVTGAFFYDVNNYEEKDIDSVLLKQLEYIKSTRKDVSIYKDKVTRTYNNKTISTIEVLGKTDNTSDSIYKLSTISFEGNLNNIIYVIQVVSKKDYTKYNNELTEIINSINLKAN